MFELEKSVGPWRQEMLAAGIKTPVPLEELEIHLREEIERQMQSGSNPEKAFELAAQKIGPVHMLKTEFAKIGGIKKPSKWKQRLVPINLVAIPSLIIYVIFEFSKAGKYEMSLTWRALAYADPVVMVLLLLGGRHIYQLFPVISNKRMRAAIGSSFLLLDVIGVIVFMEFILPNLELTVGQLMVVACWAWPLITAFAIVSPGLKEAVRRQTITSDS
jgi:hypothetical protein